MKLKLNESRLIEIIKEEISNKGMAEKVKDLVFTAIVDWGLTKEKIIEMLEDGKDGNKQENRTIKQLRIVMSMVMKRQGKNAIFQAIDEGEEEAIKYQQWRVDRESDDFYKDIDSIQGE